MEGIKHDQEKLRLDLIPALSELKLAQVLTFGAAKYDDENWKKVPNAMVRYEAAMKRHVLAYKLGEKYDQESGFSHLSHALACLTFMVALEDNKENE